MDNTIVNDIIIKRHGHYCHVLEVSDVWELEAIIDQLFNEFVDTGYNAHQIFEFFHTIEIYCLNEVNEEEVFNFSIIDHISEIR